MQLRKNASFFQTNALLIVALIWTLHFLAIAVIFSGQPPIDAHAFRQSQTAISAFWMVREGFSLAYPTPVVGKPWSIPFEFPLYQYIVSALARVTNGDINRIARIVSALFLISCTYPIYKIIKIHKFSDRLFFIFTVMLFSSPIYLYWGRSIMIETAALFFSLCAVYFFEKIYSRKEYVYSGFFLLLCASAAFLQKITTALPIFAALALIATIREIIYIKHNKKIFINRALIVFLSGFLIPSFFGYMWVVFTDNLKRANPIGQFLTSDKISNWNWGTLSQKLDLYNYKLTLIDRFTMSDSLSIVIVATVMFGVAVISNSRRHSFLFLICVFLYVLPVLIFTNLHIVHTYYQSANAIFFVLAISVIFDLLFSYKKYIFTCLILISITSIGGLYSFYENYYNTLNQDYYSGSRGFIVGQTIRHGTPEGSEFLAFGDDWSSVIPYIAERKALMVPDWYSERTQVLNRADSFLDSGRMSLVLSCGATGLSDGILLDFASARSWSTGRVTDCLVAFQPQGLIAPNAMRTRCAGYLDDLSLKKIDGKDVLYVKGWTTMSGSAAELPEKSYIELSSSSGRRYVQALRVPAPTVNDSLEISRDEISGFSALIPLRDEEKNLEINIAQRSGDISEVCEFNRDISR